MKSKIFLFAVSLLVFTACTKDETTTTLQDETLISNSENFSSYTFTPIEGQYIVTLKEGTFNTPLNVKKASMSDQDRRSLYLNEINNLKKSLNNPTAKVPGNDVSFGFNGNNVKSVFRYGLEGFVANLTEAEAETLRNHPNVKDVSNDYLIALKKPVRPNPDPEPTGQETPWGITRIGGFGDGTGKTAWIIDSGIDLDHPDLNVDTSRSLSFTGDNDPNDGNGHGTHVAGTIAAINNDFGVVGVAAGANVVALKVLGNDGSGDFSWTVQALDYVAAVGNQGDVANMSLGPSSPYIHTATDNATLNLASQGVKIAIAAGNEYDNCALYTPAHNNHQNIYTISAIAQGDVWAYFSNYGTPVDYAAPGYQIKSTYLGGGYTTMSGTSMASPHAAGILLLGNPTSDGNVTGAYWEVKGASLSGKYSTTDDYRRSVYRYDMDGNNDPIMHR